jgi:hypothetical protein
MRRRVTSYLKENLKAKKIDKKNILEMPVEEQMV